VDSSTVRFGLRRIEARQGQLLLNGQPLMLLGLNRHESHPKGGVYLPMGPLELRK
jgi:beta-galactosidase/beta-glucuronidase